MFYGGIWDLIQVYFEIEIKLLYLVYYQGRIYVIVYTILSKQRRYPEDDERVTLLWRIKGQTDRQQLK